MMRHSRTLAAVALGALLGGGAFSTVGAQTPARDPSARLKEVLPADVAARILAVIAEARARDLPAAALEHRALKFAAKGVAPDDIEKSVKEQAERLAASKDALKKGRGHEPDDDEVEAGAEALRKGVDGSKVSELAKSAPSGRSLAVPLYVISSLADRGLPSDEALQRVLQRLQEKASDRDLERLPEQAHGQGPGKPAETGRAIAETKGPGRVGRGGEGAGPPANVPANAGAGTKAKGKGKGNRP